MDLLSDYDYVLPPELIAQEPLLDRAASRLLVLGRTTGQIRHRSFRDLPDLLRSGDVLALNETRVTAVRLNGRREGTGGVVELLVLNRNGEDCFTCLCKPARSLKQGIRIELDHGLIGTVAGVGAEGERLVRFNKPELLQIAGRTPLPPYIKAALADGDRYQTVYSVPNSGAGSAAAPTAGLHFTLDMLRLIEAKGIPIARVTLDVGIDTFKPVQTEDLAAHVMHGETCTVSREAANAIGRASGRIIAVGTTTVRTLETFARLPGSVGRTVPAGTAVSKLFLRPGSEFRVVDALLTNFHLPRTTMLMMLSAFAGRENVMRAYEAAVAERYRFLSFGDAMLIV